MTATERLRQLLDERGVEWSNDFAAMPRSNYTRFEPDSGMLVNMWENGGKLGIDASTDYRFTPEQAIDATLGRGTCAKCAEAMGEYADSLCDPLKVENDKLRELVRDMMRFFEDGDYCTVCEKVAECESLEEYENDCLMRGVFKRRMAELGIEVES